MEHDDPTAFAGASIASDNSSQVDFTVPSSTVVATEAPEPLPSDMPLDTVSTSWTEPREAPPSDELPQALAALAAEMAALRRDFDTKLMYDESKQHQLDMLHQELETHRQGLQWHALRPVMLDLISLYDDLMGQAADPSGMETSPTARPPRTVALEGIEEILRRYGADTYIADAGAVVVSSRQRTINVIATDDPAQDGTVAQSLRPGFEYEGRVLRAEWIAAYRYSNAQRESTTGGDQEHV